VWSVSSSSPPPWDASGVLGQARTEALRQIADLARHFDELVAASVGSNADDEHDPEGATIAFERSQLDSLLHQARERLDEIDAAEGRLAQGRYGLCEACGHPIAEARLEARPTARTCIVCASDGGRRPDRATLGAPRSRDMSH